MWPTEALTMKSGPRYFWIVFAFAPDSTISSVLLTAPHTFDTSWRPQRVDYVALSFYTSMACLLADVAVLSQWAKLRTMVEAIIAFTRARPRQRPGARRPAGSRASPTFAR